MTKDERTKEYKYLIAIAPYCPPTFDDVEPTLRMFHSAIASAGGCMHKCAVHRNRKMLKVYTNRHTTLLECRALYVESLSDEFRLRAKQELPSWLTSFF